MSTLRSARRARARRSRDRSCGRLVHRKHAAHELGRNFIGVDLLSAREISEDRRRGSQPHRRPRGCLDRQRHRPAAGCRDRYPVGRARGGNAKECEVQCPARALQRSRSLRRSRIDLFVPDGTTECAPWPRPRCGARSIRPWAAGRRVARHRLPGFHQHGREIAGRTTQAVHLRRPGQRAAHCDGAVDGNSNHPGCPGWPDTRLPTRFSWRSVGNPLARFSPMLKGCSMRPARNTTWNSA